MKKEIIITSIYSIIHFLVDMSCAATMIGFITANLTDNFILAFVLYNFFAFAFELPAGLVADKINKNSIVSAIGCLLVFLGILLNHIPILGAVMLGIGNGMFHVGGGIDVLNISNKKATLPGIFVSTGALGLYLGVKFNSFYKVNILLVMIAMILSALALCWLYYKNKKEYKIQNFKSLNKDSKEVKLKKFLISIPLFIVVIIRGYMGLILNYEWKSQLSIAIISILCVVLGKCLGGIIGDKYGWKKTTIVSLLLSIILFMFSFKSWICGCIAILLFNMTMPLTLTALSNMFEERKGVAFGITTTGLFIGALPVLLNLDFGAFNILGIISMTSLSLFALYYALKHYEEVVDC